MRVANADNGGNGVTGVAAFDYSQLVGSDLQPDEETATRGLKYNNPNTVLFTFTARVIASVPAGAGAAAGTTSTTGSGDTNSGPSGEPASGSGTTGTEGTPLTTTTLLKFTVNPLTKTVSVTPLR